MPSKRRADWRINRIPANAIIGGSAQASADDYAPALIDGSLDAPDDLALQTALYISALAPSALILAEWSAPSGMSQAERYTIQCSTSSAFPSDATRQETCPLPTYQIAPLDTSTLYYVRVRAWEHGIATGWSAPVAITTPDDTVPPAAPTSPSASFDIGGTLNVAWTPPTQAANRNFKDVEIRIWTNSSKTALLDIQHATSKLAWAKERNYAVTGTDYSTTVYVELRSRSAWEQYSAAVVVGTITKARPGNPTLSATPVFNNTSGELAFDWPDIPDADHYEITVNGKVYPSATSKFVYTLAFNMNDNAGTPVATVVYSIKAVDALGQRSTGGSAGTVTKPLPATPSVSFVWDGKTGNLHFSWITVGDAVRYNLDLDAAHYYAAAPLTYFNYDAARNRSDHSGTGDPSITYAVRAQDILQQLSAPSSGVATLAKPATPSGLASSWDADTGIAGADCVISWAASSAVASWRLSIDGVARDAATNTFPYAKDTNAAEHSGALDKTLALSLVAIDGLGQTSATPATLTATNAAPPSVSVTIAGGYSEIAIALGASAANDLAFYQLRIIKDGADLTTIRTPSRNTIATATARGTYQVGVTVVDAFGNASSETLSTSLLLDALTVAENRADTIYSDNRGNTDASLAVLKDDGYSTWVNYATGATWNWTQIERPYLSRIRTLTLCTWHGTAGTVVGYVMTSADGSTWRYFAGPQTGTILTEVASEAAAQAAAVAWSAFPTMARWDLPGFVEARFVKIGHRNPDTTGSYYNLRELYPRRLTQTDDLDVEAVRAINIGAKQVTADHLSVLELSAIIGDMGSLTAGQIVIGTLNKLWLNDSDDGGLAIGGTAKASAPFRVTAAGALTATNATITGRVNFGGGSGYLDATGLNFLMGATYGAVDNSLNFLDGTTREHVINAYYFKPSGLPATWNHNLTIDTLADAASHSNLYLRAYAAAGKQAFAQTAALYNTSAAIAKTEHVATSGTAVAATTAATAATIPARVDLEADSGSTVSRLRISADSDADTPATAEYTGDLFSILGDLRTSGITTLGYLAADSYAQIWRQTNQTVLRSVHPGQALLDITTNPGDGTSAATIRLFRETVSTGLIQFQVLNGASGANVILGGNGDSMIAQQYGSLAVGGTPSFGGGSGVLYLANRRTAPSSTPSGGGILYVQAGALRYRGSSGNDVQIAGA